jgi:hypothetical protein
MTQLENSYPKICSLSYLKHCVHALNDRQIHNHDITHILGLQHVPNHVGRLTNYLLKDKRGPVYKTSTVIYSELNNESVERVNSIERYAMHARQYLQYLAIEIVVYVSKNNSCTQSEIATNCLGVSRHNDHNWIACQLLDVMDHHKIILKRKQKFRTSITQVDDSMLIDTICKIKNTMFTFGYAEIQAYMVSKNIGSIHERIYTQHLIKNAKLFNIVRIELQKSFEGLVGIGGGLLRFDIYIEQTNGQKGMIEIDELKHHKYHKPTVQHDLLKLQFSSSSDQYVLIRLDQNN